MMMYENYRNIWGNNLNKFMPKLSNTYNDFNVKSFIKEHKIEISFHNCFMCAPQYEGRKTTEK